VTVLREASDPVSEVLRAGTTSDEVAGVSIPSSSGRAHIAVGSSDATSKAEGGLSSESDELKNQARQSDLPREAENLLGPRIDEQPDA